MVLAAFGLLVRVSIAVAILIRDYSFFETMVISILALMFSSMALKDAEVEKGKDDAKEEPPSRELWALIATGSRRFAYSIIALMAFAKLLLALFR
jgi:hypothetical protein